MSSHVNPEPWFKEVAYQLAQSRQRLSQGPNHLVSSLPKCDAPERKYERGCNQTQSPHPYVVKMENKIQLADVFK